MSEFIGTNLLGRYRVEAFIGRGGMAEVYKVWDTQRSVHLAMKLLREDLAEDKVFMRRFQREARTLANLQHPNIVRFYGLEQDDYLAFMLMDFVDGTTLRREIYRAKGPLSVERILEIMRPVCAALGYAHNLGIVHCDAKPGNIMIEANGRVLMTDFGIARMTDAATATMIGAGTPAYMAPEQARGEDPSPLTDIYALGVVLYEMLTGGERPFTGERAETTGSTGEKVRWEQMHLQPPSPSKWNPKITQELESLVMRCLSKEPGQRYGDVITLLNALETTLGDVSLAQPMPPVDRVVVPQEPVQVAPVDVEPVSEAPTALGPDPGSTPVEIRVKAQAPVVARETSVSAPAAIQPEATTALDWGFMVQWMLANALAFPIGYFIAESMDEIWITFLWGGVIGLAQWLVLRGRFKDIGWWILTPMVCLFLWYMLDFSRNPILGLMLGALIGAGQWLLLRNPIDHEAVRQGGGS